MRSWSTRMRVLGVAALALMSPLGGILAPAASAQDNAEITLWMDTTGGSTTADCIVKNVIEPFNASGAGVTVKATMQANAWDATRTALQGGAGPDIVTTPGPSFAMQLARANQLVALDEYAKQFNWNETFSKGALDLGMVDGKLYSIPAEQETVVLYYNKTLFEQHGWTPPKTLDELMTLSKTIADAGIIPIANSNSEWRPTNEWFVGEFLNHYAGPQKVYEALSGKLDWTDPDFVKSMDMLAEMMKNGWFMGGLDRYYTLTSAEARGAFGDGEAAMKIEGTWFVADAPDAFGAEAGNDNDWDWVPMPSKDGTAIFDMAIGSTYSINANSKNPDAAAKYLDYFFSPKTQATLISECGMAVAPVNLAGQDLSKVDPRLTAILADLNKAYADNTYGYTTWTFWPPAAENTLIEDVEKVWAGDMTSTDYLKAMQDKMNEERTDGAMPPLPPR